MNRLGVAILAWVMFGLERGFRDALELGDTGIVPSFVFVLVTFIGISAPPLAALWTALVLGVVMDLTSIIAVEGVGSAAAVLGPHALGYVLAVQLMLTLRGIMIRRNPLTMGFLALCGSAVAQTVLVAIFSIRSALGDPIVWQPADELVLRLASGVYTGVIAVGLAVLMLPLAGMLGLSTQSPGRFGPR